MAKSILKLASEILFCCALLRLQALPSPLTKAPHRSRRRVRATLPSFAVTSWATIARCSSAYNRTEQS